jgi:hypothetical protein
LPERKHSDFYYCVKYGLREKTIVTGLRRFGLGWRLIIRKT